MISIVGVGIAKGHLTDNGRKIIDNADIIYGSYKAIELVKEYIKCKTIVMKRFDKTEYDEIEKAGKQKNVVVLSTGDPMVSGLGLKIKADVIEPGISSIQVALSRLKVNLCEVIVIDCHAKDCLDKLDANTLDAIAKTGIKKILMLVTKGFRVSLINFKTRKIIVLENLCNPNERVFSVNGDFTVASNNTILYLEL